MQRYTKTNLEWVSRNRQPGWRHRTIGELAAHALDDRRLSQAQRLGALQRAIAESTDEEFGRHCTLGELRAGTLTILVDDPSCAAGLCAQWLLPLQRLLRRGTPRVSRVRFAEGRSHLRFDKAYAQREGSGNGSPPGADKAR